MRIKLTAKLKSLKAFSLLAAYPPPVSMTPLSRCKKRIIFLNFIVVGIDIVS